MDKHCPFHTEAGQDRGEVIHVEKLSNKQEFYKSIPQHLPVAVRFMKLVKKSLRLCMLYASEYSTSGKLNQTVVLQKGKPHYFKLKKDLVNEGFCEKMLGDDDTESDSSDEELITLFEKAAERFIVEGQHWDAAYEKALSDCSMLYDNEDSDVSFEILEELRSYDCSQFVDNANSMMQLATLQVEFCENTIGGLKGCQHVLSRYCRKYRQAIQNFEDMMAKSAYQ